MIAQESYNENGNCSVPGGATNTSCETAPNPRTADPNVSYFTSTDAPQIETLPTPRSAAPRPARVRRPIRSASSSRCSGPPGQLSRLVELGLLEPRGLSFVARNPAMLDTAAATVLEGIPARDLLMVLEEARPHFDAIAKVLVEMVVRHLDRYDAGALPPPTDMPALVEAIWRLRLLSTVFVENEILRALEEQAGAYLGGRVATILDKTLGGQAAKTSPPKNAPRAARKTSAQKAPVAASKTPRAAAKAVRTTRKSGTNQHLSGVAITEKCVVEFKAIFRGKWRRAVGAMHFARNSTATRP